LPSDWTVVNSISEPRKIFWHRTKPVARRRRNQEGDRRSACGNQTANVPLLRFSYRSRANECFIRFRFGPIDLQSLWIGSDHALAVCYFEIVNGKRGSRCHISAGRGGFAEHGLVLSRLR